MTGKRCVTLGIVGGCLSHQKGIPQSQLFHRQLARRLGGVGQVRLRVRIARDFRETDVERLEHLADRYSLDGVLLHVRPSFVARKSRLLVRHLAGGAARYYVHPFLFNRRKLGWESVERSDFDRCWWIFQERARWEGARGEPPPVFSGARTAVRSATGYHVSELNVLVGHWVGLGAWAVRDELAQVRTFGEACRSRNLPWILLGTPVFARRPHVRTLYTAMTDALQAFARTADVPYCPLPRTEDSAGHPFFLADMRHLSEAGHTYVAEQLFPVVWSWSQRVAAESAETSAPRPERSSPPAFLPS